ncbi:MAG: IclR family transcriptional regulator [Gammaproteobacteria bacterium]|nr:IclR family transcriptional regulator [Gammaproteobacteria bacterium]
MEPQPNKKEDRLFVASIEKAFQVLEAFRGDRRDLGLTDIMSRTSLGKSATQRYIHTLERLEYLQKDESTRRYKLSKKILEPANSFLRTNPLVTTTTPYLVDLRSKLNARIGLACEHGTQAMYLLPLQSNNVAFRTAQPGFTVPLFCSAAGRLFLSIKSDEKIRLFLESIERPKYTPKTITDIEQILSEIQTTRVKGFSVTEEELRLGDVNLAVPVFGSLGELIASLVVVCNRHEWSRERVIDEVYPLVSATAQSISTQY